ncbi:helix-turn-helix transcriptional regulator [Streptomyces sp. CMB-StM0423]|uniref:helix-turn-helix transcriptional regulator n=1 Tax=Streptomyces sp. CMB-StM0423 TaxID=2059884 RepID=UPI000C6FD077|nr:XRE family transcriptional regulator [Streptomyces sp. CMB-StM0423]
MSAHDETLTYRQAVGARIRELRVESNLTQWQLGELVGADHKTIHRIEYGRSDPPLSLLVRIARA